jgi:aconitate hydratase
VVAAYLTQSGLQSYLDNFRINLVGFGCTTCTGTRVRRSGNFEGDPDNGLIAAAVLGNRTRGSRQPRRAGELSGVAAARRRHALAGSVQKDLTREPLGTGSDGSRLPQRYLASCRRKFKIHHRNITRNVQVALCRSFSKVIATGKRS